MKAIDAGLHVLLESRSHSGSTNAAPSRAAPANGVLVGICHVLRYHPYFAKIREIVDSGELGQIISVNHVAAVGIDRTTHSYVRGLAARRDLQPDAAGQVLPRRRFPALDHPEAPCRKLSSFGSLRWFRAANAPQTSAERCIDCPVEHDCPYSAVDLYCTRRDWISNFDVPQGTHARRSAPWKNCATAPTAAASTAATTTWSTTSCSPWNSRTRRSSRSRWTSSRRTTAGAPIKMTHGEIFGDERKLHVHRFRRGHNRVYDFEELAGHPFPCGRRPAADRRFRRRADPPRPPFPLHDRGFDREPPHLFRGRAQPPLRRTIRLE